LAERGYRGDQNAQVLRREHGDDAVDARGHGDLLAAGWFELVLPPEVQRERARKNSEGRPDHTGAPSSDSGASTTATPSPLSA
ncbi:MAG: hypothetical protein EBT13_15585, partial [Rhodobacteraceae bacterium]|nr:hypothetical protein [Paracoccaceae bacterium]